MKGQDIGKAGFVIVVALVAMASADIFAQSKPRPKLKSAAKPLPTPKPVQTPVVAPAVEPVITDPAKCTAANGLSLAEINEILADHNTARHERQIPDVTWNCKLAQLAQEWANKSIYAHREDTSFGENIFVSGNSAEPIGSVLRRWMLEKPNWTNETATCAAGKVCTHYTQIMWRQTRSIGCGINRSATGKWKAVVVCNYDVASLSSGPAW